MRRSTKTSVLGLIAAIVALAAMLFSGSAMAQGPIGIGFAQAEEGTWWCRGDNTVETLDCARDRCEAEAGGQECLRTAWCYPAGWSGLMTVWLGEFHTTEIVCGAPSRGALEAALDGFCVANAFAVSCDTFLFIDPEGNEIDAFLSFTGPAGDIAP